MKTRLLLFMTLFTSAAFAQIQQYEFGIGYTYAAPVNTMKQNIKHGNGITMDFYVTPEKNNRFAFGLDINYTIYGHDKSRQTYTFDDGTVAPMDIIVDNTFLNFMAGARYYITSVDDKKFKPYIMVKGGYSWFRTNLNIYDVDDEDHCKPVDKDLLMKDGTYSFSGGAGVHWDLSSIFKKQPTNRWLFNLSAGLTLGGKVYYMNTDAPPQHHTNHNNSDVTAPFVNTQTQVVHEHHVGYVYSSTVEMIDFRAGFIYRMEPWYRGF
jgi:hypothetical protein